MKDPMPPTPEQKVIRREVVKIVLAGLAVLGLANGAAWVALWKSVHSKATETAQKAGQDAATEWLNRSELPLRAKIEQHEKMVSTLLDDQTQKTTDSIGHAKEKLARLDEQMNIMGTNLGTTEARLTNEVTKKIEEQLGRIERESERLMKLTSQIDEIVSVTTNLQGEEAHNRLRMLEALASTMKEGEPLHRLTTIESRLPKIEQTILEVNESIRKLTRDTEDLSGRVGTATQRTQRVTTRSNELLALVQRVIWDFEAILGHNPSLKMDDGRRQDIAALLNDRDLKKLPE